MSEQEPGFYYVEADAITKDENTQGVLIIPPGGCAQTAILGPYVRFLQKFYATPFDNDDTPQIRVIPMDNDGETVFQVILVTPLTPQVSHLFEPGAPFLSLTELSQLLADFFDSLPSRESKIDECLDYCNCL